jgi:iron(III) transport system ATP-binding protein
MPDDDSHHIGNRSHHSDIYVEWIGSFSQNFSETKMIQMNQVAKSYQETKAVNQISFDVPAESSIVILGPSGSGKTTLLRLIAGLEMPDTGEIFLDGALASRAGWVMTPYQRRIGFVFQTSALWPHLTVAQNILFGLYDIPRKDANKRLHALLDKTSLIGLENRYPHQLSGGEARRVALARTLAPRPKRLLMDEPLTNVDPELKCKMLSLIKQSVIDAKACLIYVTHDAGEAAEISRRVLTMIEGRLEPLLVK